MKRQANHSPSAARHRSASALQKAGRAHACRDVELPVRARAQLTLMCRLDGELLQMRGVERWEEPVPNGFEASRLIVRQDCEANGPCSKAQVERAQRELGFRLVGRAGPFAVLPR